MNDLFNETEDIELAENPHKRMLMITGIVIIVIICLALGGLSWVNRDRVMGFGGDDEPVRESLVEEEDVTAVPDEDVAETPPNSTEETEAVIAATAVAMPTATKPDPTEIPSTVTERSCIEFVRTFTTSNVRAEPTLGSDNVVARTAARQVLCVVEVASWPEMWYQVEYAPGEYGWIGSTQIQVCFSEERC